MSDRSDRRTGVLVQGKVQLVGAQIDEVLEDVEGVDILGLKERLLSMGGVAIVRLPLVYTHGSTCRLPNDLQSA